MFFPETTIKSAGRSFDAQNENKGDFYGVITDIRPIKSKSNENCFGVIDIHAKGQALPFQFYLNYNPDETPDREDGTSPAKRSMSYLVGSAKDLIKACGDTPKLDEIRDMEWCEKVFNKYKDSKTVFQFHQGKGKKGLEIKFLPKIEEENTTSTDEVDL